MFRKRRRRRASSDGEGEGGSQRVQLACFWCRSKRVRCSGTKPVCEVSRSSSQDDDRSERTGIENVSADYRLVRNRM